MLIYDYQNGTGTASIEGKLTLKMSLNSFSCYINQKKKVQFLYLLLMRYSAVACFTPDATTDRLNLTAKTQDRSLHEWRLQAAEL